MKILLTNDDGYDAVNIQNLYKALSKDHEVWIVAPANNCSGMSAAISFLKDTEITKINDYTYAVDGTPADCTYFGLLSVLGFEPDIVVSGINHGANLGNDVLYSGTVGAAVGGRSLKFPPVAISVASYDAKDPEYIATKSADIVNKIFKNPLSFENKILNINFPDLLEKDVKGTKFTRLSRRGIPAAPVEISSSHNSKTYRYNLQGEAIKESYLSDVEAVQSGYISLSILDYNLTKTDEEKNHLVKILCE
tara:strand:- start:335 stop:1084 length:750 start_codon:yes stop_codon:yes gene_type:complete